MSSKKQHITIIQETDQWVAVNKPPFVPSLPERGKYTAESVLEWSKKKWPDSILCHRIDRETSGVLLIAKDADTYRHISIQFEKRKIEKIYHAIVDGVVDFQDFWVDLPINTDNLNNIKIDKQFGKLAQTHFQTIETFRHFTLLQCKPKTGRLHQIRVHLSSQNARISADEMYGSQTPMLSLIKRKISGENRPLIQRFALHARELVFRDIQDQEISVKAEYPNDFGVFLKLLDKYDR